MQKNHAKAKLQAGECIYGTSVEYCLDPEISVLLAKAGLDMFFIDTEHQAASLRPDSGDLPYGARFWHPGSGPNHPERSGADHPSTRLWGDGNRRSSACIPPSRLAARSR